LSGLIPFTLGSWSRSRDMALRKGFAGMGVYAHRKSRGRD